MHVISQEKNVIMKKIGKKLRELRENLNLTQGRFAQEIGVTQKTIAFWENDKNEPNAENILTICNKYNIDKDFFNTYDVIIDKAPEYNEPTIDGDYYPDVFGSCGNGIFVLSETKEKIKIPEKCFIKPISRVAKYSVINAVGDSMSPTINDKDRLIIQHCENEPIQDKSIYIFCYDNQMFVKRLYYNIDEIMVKSDNPEFKTKFIQKEDINNLIIIGQVVGLMRDLR